MRFLQSHYLLLFLAALALLPLSFYRLTRTLRARRAASPPLRRISVLSSVWGDLATFVLAHLALAALILALAQPQWQRSVVVPEFKQVDLVFLVDISPSMRAEDIRPSRLDRALDVIASFGERKAPQDRIGLVTFAGRSVVMSYLTEDPANIRYYLDYLRQDRVPRMGTDIGRALDNGLALLAKEREINPRAAERRSVFVLVSDGEDHGAGLDDALGKVRKRGVKLHTIAIGSAHGAPIPIAWDDGRPQYVLDAKGNRVISRIDEGTLRRLARETGGGAYRAVTGDELPDTLARIIESEREIRGFKQRVEYRDLQQALLSAAFGLLLTAMLVRGARV